MIAALLLALAGTCTPPAPIVACVGPSNVTIMRADTRGTYTHFAHLGTLTKEG